jgi:hypothetical protein
MKYEDVKVGLLVEDDKGRKGTVTKKLKNRATVLFQKVVNGMVIDHSAILFPADFARIFPVNPGRSILKSIPPSVTNVSTEEIKAYKWLNDTIQAYKADNTDKITGFDYWLNLASIILNKYTSRITKEERNAVKSTVFHLMYSPNKKALKKDIKQFVKSVQNDE